MAEMTNDASRGAGTYLLSSIPAFIDSITYRALADGLLIQDLEDAKARVTDWAEWCDHWVGRAMHHERLADASLEAGYRLTAGRHLVRASLCAHYGQFLAVAYPKAKHAGTMLKVRLFERAAPLLSPPAEPVGIPFEDYELPGYLMVPGADGPSACVIHIGGLDAAKEDAIGLARLCLERGLAVLTFDGPGQGETYYWGKRLGPSFHRAVSAAIDFLEKRAEIDVGRIGVIGRSTGGFLAPEAAAHDHRIKAVVAWGAMYDLANIDTIPPLVRDTFQFITGAKNPEETREATAFIDLSGVAERITCPLYVVHGGRDNITPPENATRLVEQAGGPTTLALYEDSIHCNHDVAHIVRPDMADWLASQLGA